MQTGFLTPILNALRAEEFLLINNKSRKAINYFVGKRYPQTIRDYAEVNAAGWQLLDAVKDEIGAAELPNLSQADAFDMFDHWLWAEKGYWDTKKEGVRYWKIAPGEDASNWEACRDGGYIAIGWDELGNLSAITRKEFGAKRDELVAQFDDWTKAGTEQAWKFAHQINEGDRVVANRGTSEVIGIGTVSGDYYFVAGERHGHRIPVEWDDVGVRDVNEGGWRRTLIKLDRAKFEEIEKLKTEPPNGPVKDAAFSEDTFRLLAGLHENPTRDFYNAHKGKFKEHLEEPLRQLFKDVARELAPPVADFMETERNIQARILKNDWGRGGAWDFLWGAFYPKGGKRTEDAQLFVVVQRDRLEYGFYIGEYGSEQRDRFVRNCTQNREALVNLLRQELSGEGSLVFGEREESVGGPEDPGFPNREVDWKAWLADPGGVGIHAGVFVGKADVLATPLDKLSGKIADTFNKLFPFVFLAAHEAPMPAIREYIEGEIENHENPEYSLEECAEDTCFEKEMLERWARAIERKKQAVIYGPPGTSKTFLAEHLARHLVGGDDGFVEVVQFHPAYAYEDFIQGLRPRAKPDGGLDYPVVPGRFLRFCEEASRRDGVCVLIIDEINRANLARVFGELMYLLEYRDKEVPLAAGRKFSIPHNVRVIGTMNTADRSIALVDHALRRRFAFLELYPDYEVLRAYHEKNGTGFAVEGLVNTLKQLNNAIGDRHYHVGITYFLRSDLGEHVEDIWRMEVSPYLEEFFFDEPDKAAQFSWKNVKEKVSPA
jgi:5-methylcytosine-specific restriction protein B